MRGASPQSHDASGWGSSNVRTRSGYCLRTPPGGGGFVWGPGQPRPTHPQRGRNLRPILGAQTFFGLCPPPPPPGGGSP